MKSCRICRSSLPLDRFVKSKVFKSGYDTICLDCSRQKVREWRQAGKRKSAEESQRYYERYPEKGRARAAAYRTRKRKALPQWVDINEIENIYLSCPEGHHVDHIVPLKGKEVCGLHVPWNLQYLPAKENISKGNRFYG